MATLDSAESATVVSAAARLWSRADALLRRPAFAYLTIALLQLVAVWGMWERRDLTRGDTATYYRIAYSWYDHRADNIAWSPLYTTFYGSMLFLTRDPCAATVLHRLVIVFLATLLVLSVLRRLLPASVAWLAAAWWAALPIQFDTLYEVHLFAVLPVLACWRLAAGDRVWNRGAALGVLAGAGLLVRNEMGLAALLFGCVCLWREWPALRSGGWGGRLGRAAAYGLPLAAVALLVAFFYRHSESKFNDPDRMSLREQLRIKHELNMAQVYAFGYLQRHPEWKHSPWLDHGPLMLETFGREMLPLSAMVRANPRAVLQHVAWNFRLVPHGLQVLLFNATSGRSGPDYVPVNSRSPAALVASVAMLAVWAVGAMLLFRNRRAELAAYLRGRGTVWLAMLCVAAVAVPVIATQRPRPSYLLPLGIVLIAVTGLSATAILQRFALLRRGASVVAPVALACYLASPLHPPLTAVEAQTPLSDAVHRLQPYQALLARPETRFLAGEFGFELMAYPGLARGESFGPDLLDGRRVGVSFDAFLDERRINLVYLDEGLLTRLEEDTTGDAKAFLTPGKSPWILIGSGDVPGCRWRLYKLQEAGAASAASHRTGAASAPEFDTGRGNHASAD